MKKAHKNSTKLRLEVPFEIKNRTTLVRTLSCEEVKG
jgi:hypothetical protein